MAEQTTAEWARSLTADQCVALVHRTLDAHDPRGTVAALHLLAVKDPDRAQEFLDAINAGIAIARGEPLQVRLIATLDRTEADAP